MVKTALSEICQTDGVEGAFIASVRGEIVQKQGLVYENKQLSAMAIHMLRMVAAFHLTGKKVTELEFYWQNQYIICKSTEQFMAVTFCRNTRILSFIRISLNVMVASLMEDKKFSRWLKSHKADRDFTLRKGNLTESESQLIKAMR